MSGELALDNLHVGKAVDVGEQRFELSCWERMVLRTAVPVLPMQPKKANFCISVWDMVDTFCDFSDWMIDCLATL